MPEAKKKSFWSKPEGVTGALVLGGALIGGGILINTFIAGIVGFLSTTIGLVVSILTLGGIIFMALDPKMRALVGYMYKSLMRWITGIFIEIDPIAILNSYVEELKGNLRKMNRQISQLRGQMHKLKEIILNNKKEKDCKKLFVHLTGMVMVYRQCMFLGKCWAKDHLVLYVLLIIELLDTKLQLNHTKNQSLKIVLKLKDVGKKYKLWNK